MTKNIPTAILFREEGSRPRRFRMGSTTLSFRGISMRMSTASNMVSQAAGKRNVIWEEKHKSRLSCGVTEGISVIKALQNTTYNLSERDTGTEAALVRRNQVEVLLWRSSHIQAADL
ncbi:hypothetical protein EYF80_020768 [Liparis tanakae]|uniref:Uncharacterized protein n=1 Tax=Liparis tanakae TaxID=230148 RepID=A0A4Z2HUU1_9TELE|nr:hypothetical protein EYF80_020768 [Liparis tanakae]